MPTKYESTLLPQVIYVFRICDETHQGCLKVGMTKLTGDHSNFLALQENCEELNTIARERINEYTGTAAVPYELLHTELSLFFKGGKIGAFDDHQVHEILLLSGIKKKEFTFTDKAKEWFITDLQTVQNAIHAAKEGRKSLKADEITKGNSPIEFRPEQREAISRSVKKFQIPGTRMLWNCKMRFGKTLSALQVVKEMLFHRTIIVTHRPVVDAGWFEDFDKIFYDKPEYLYGSKNNGEPFDTLSTGTNPFIYFASMQDLRGSAEVGGKFDKNNVIFKTKWDLVIIDEAHEGTQTELGQKVLKSLIKSKTCTIDLSGTPFNIVSDYNEDEIVNWTYVDEQREKEKWAKEHPCDYNPYGGLPHMNMSIYDLNTVFEGYENTIGDIQFNFSEFFRTWTGDPKKDHRHMPAGVQEGTFIHETDVKKFLDLLVKSDQSTNYPYSTPEYRNIFRHTFWVVPGVAAGKALSILLKQHPVFGTFDIVNVCGEGDDDTANEEALQAVNNAIGPNPEETYTITLSCGRLTTGVSIKAWTAVFMLYGSTKTKAQGYMQTIFRVQTPAVIGGKRKEECYVFDFAPDRVVSAIDETIRAASYARQTQPGTQSKVVTDEEREDFNEFMKYCSVIAYDGSRMLPYDVTQLLEHLKRVQIERVVRNGFEDNALYNNDLLMNLEDDNIDELEDVKGIIGTSKAQKQMGDFVVNDQGLDGDDNSPKPKKPKTPLTPEEEEKRKELAKKKKQKQSAISILRGISIRFPMLIYGADVKDESEGITLDNFTSFIDKESWAEFMPNGISMQKFYALRKYYDPDVFNACGKRIREKARAADSLPPLERIHRITDIFSTFRNPDKETVLTPWRVVNMHLSDTIGGYDFFDEMHQLPIDEPRLVEHGKTTWRIFEKDKPRILEINSKSGLYPLYMAYSLYRVQLKKWLAEDLFSDPNNISLEEQQMIWDDVIQNNIFVLCKTPMAAKITRRTLVGYRDVKVKARSIDNLLDEIQNNQESIIKLLRQGKSFWHDKNETDMIQFDAIVGNPPYQVNVGVEKDNYGILVFQDFVNLGLRLNPYYATMIFPSRWFTGGRGLDSFRNQMLNDDRLSKIVDFVDSDECFPSADISGGINYILWDRLYHGLCDFTTIHKGVSSNQMRKLNEYDVFIRRNEAINIIKKVNEKNEASCKSLISPQTPFGFVSSFVGEKNPFEGCLKLYGSNKVISYVAEDDVKRNKELVDKYKVIFTKAAPGGGRSDRSGRYLLITSLQLLEPKEICTQTFLVGAVFEDKNEAIIFMDYLKTKFVRFLVLQSMSSQDLGAEKFQFVPLQDFTRPWTDTDLYAKYNLSPDEIAYIESLIKPMDEPKFPDAKPSDNQKKEVKIEIHQYGDIKAENVTFSGNNTQQGDIINGGTYVKNVEHMTTELKQKEKNNS